MYGLYIFVKNLGLVSVFFCRSVYMFCAITLLSSLLWLFSVIWVWLCVLEPFVCQCTFWELFFFRVCEDIIGNLMGILQTLWLSSCDSHAPNTDSSHPWTWEVFLILMSSSIYFFCVLNSHCTDLSPTCLYLLIDFFLTINRFFSLSAFFWGGGKFAIDI